LKYIDFYSNANITAQTKIARYVRGCYLNCFCGLSVQTFHPTTHASSWYYCSRIETWVKEQ